MWRNIDWDRSSSIHLLLPKLSLYKCKRKRLDEDAFLIFFFLCWHLEGNRSAKYWFGENGDRVNLFLHFSSSSILGLRTYLICSHRAHGKDAYSVHHGKFGWRLSGPCFLQKKNVDFNEMNSPSFLDDKQIETEGTQPFLTCIDFWHLEAFRRASDNELTYWLAINLDKILQYVLLQTPIVVLPAKSAILFFPICNLFLNGRKTLGNLLKCLNLGKQHSSDSK